MQTQNPDVLTVQDIASLNMVVEHLSQVKKFHRENSYYLLETEFGVRSITHIKRADYDRAMALLVDLHNVTMH